MPYAANGQISQSPIEGGISISEEQYQQALAAIVNGQRIGAVGGELFIYSLEKRTVYSTDDGTEKEIHDNEPTPEGYTDEARPSRWHEWVDGEWVEDAAAALNDAQARQIQAINDAYSQAVAPLIKDYPEVETKSWPQQDTESLAYIAWHDSREQGDPPATPVLDRILTGRNGEGGTETMLELCHAVRANADMFAQAQELTGRRQRLVKQIRQAGTVEEVEAVVWPE